MDPGDEWTPGCERRAKSTRRVGGGRKTRQPENPVKYNDNRGRVSGGVAARPTATSYARRQRVSDDDEDGDDGDTQDLRDPEICCATEISTAASSSASRSCVCTSTATTSTSGSPSGDTDLHEMLAMRNLPQMTSRREVEAEFDKIASFLVNYCTVMINHVPHRFAELEFYLNGPTHQDTFTHGDQMQRTCANWYFHRVGGKYKGGTFKGMDLTFGPESAYGGILIRGLYDMVNNTLLDGPCVCVDHILKLNSCPSIEAFVTKEGTTVAFVDIGQPKAQRGLYIESHPNLASRDIQPLKTPRVGLTLKNYSPHREEFIMQLYRYVAEPAATRKGKYHMCAALHARGTAQDEVCRITRATPSTAQLAAQLFDKGASCPTTQFRRFLDVILSDEAVCELYGICSKFE
ncbi:hypothetical protein Pelo_14741 [Pelomyxa schiedti]|nr:hypothetical protein Pelo_14741 [Pelomyxa schiedti]